MRLHAARHVHRVAPQVVEEAAAADHAGHDRARADADAQPEIAAIALGEAGLRALAQLERETGECLRVIGARARNARRDHVAVADRLDLLDLVAIDDLVEAREETIEEPDDLARIELAGEGGEVDDVGEEDARVLEVVGDRLLIGLQTLRHLLREDVQEERVGSRLCGVAPAREGYEQHHRHERDRDDVEDVEGADEALGQVAGVRPNHLGEDEREHDRGDERREPRPRPARAVERDGAERCEERPHDHRARFVEAPERHDPERGGDEDQEQLGRPEKREVSVAREDREADDRSRDVAPRRERDDGLAEREVHAAPDESDREDEQGDADEEAPAKALVGRVAGSAPIERSRSTPERSLLTTASVDGTLQCCALVCAAPLGHPEWRSCCAGSRSRCRSRSR